MPSLLFVCTGNTCRSPMAEGLAKAMLDSGVVVQSAGTHAWPGTPASTNACLAMQEAGLTIDTHTSSILTCEMLEAATLVLCMTAGHLDIVQSMCSDANAFTLGGYSGLGYDVSDPFGQDIHVYKECMAQISDMIGIAAPKLKEDLWKV